MMQVIFALFIGLSGNAGYKSLGTARLLSAVVPGAGQFYVHNYWKGVRDFGIESGLLGATIFSLYARNESPEKDEAKEGEVTKEDYTVLAILSGASAIGYYIFQLWRLNDDVVVYNYKKRFLKSTSLELNFNPGKYNLMLVKRF